MKHHWHNQIRQQWVTKWELRYNNYFPVPFLLLLVLLGCPRRGCSDSTLLPSTGSSAWTTAGVCIRSSTTWTGASAALDEGAKVLDKGVTPAWNRRWMSSSTSPRAGAVGVDDNPLVFVKIWASYQDKSSAQYWGEESNVCLSEVKCSFQLTPLGPIVLSENVLSGLHTNVSYDTPMLKGQQSSK